MITRVSLVKGEDHHLFRSLDLTVNVQQEVLNVETTLAVEAHISFTSYPEHHSKILQETKNESVQNFNIETNMYKILGDRW